MRLVVLHHHAGAERMKEDVDLVRGQQIVGRDLVGRGVVGLRQDLAEDQMRRVEPVEPVDPRQQIGGDALHHPMHLAMNIGVQPAEIRHPRGRAHAAEKAVALDQQRAPPGARGSDRSGNAGGPAAEHGDFIFAVERNLARGFFDGFGRQVDRSRMASGRSCPGRANLAISPNGRASVPRRCAAGQDAKCGA